MATVGDGIAVGVGQVTGMVGRETVGVSERLQGG